MDKIRVGIVGAGFIGPIHIEAIRRLGYPEITAIAEVNQETANTAASDLKIPKAYGDWHDLVNDPDIDVVHATCSNMLHYPVSKACIEAGKSIICEKPLTMDISEARELVRLAKEKNVINATTFNMSFYPMVREAKEMVARGELGKINLVSGRYLQDWLVKESDYNWRVEAKYQGKTRVISDIGSHWMQMVQMILDKKIISVYGDITTFIPYRKKPMVRLKTAQEIELKAGEYEEIKVDTEDHATIMFKFEGGIKGVLIAAQICPGRKQRIEWEITGVEKSVFWEGEEPNKLWIGYRNRPNEIFMKDPNLMSANTRELSSFSAGLAEGYGDSWKNIISSIYNYIKIEGNKKNLKPDFPTFEEGYKIMTIIDAIIKSVEENKWIDIDWSIT
ncbi:MAG: Gfo/Idh/MocA family oxidoreductase [Actinobacteria bacterium]|nr:Gfo/Idh/MocA family oxidoreductase [Actinomycetota bacterium]